MKPDNDEPCEHLGGKHIPFGSDAKPDLLTRILELTGPGSVRLRVVDSASSGKAHYACLSHCWGGIKVLCLTRSRLKSFQKGIPWSSMPPTFRDALGVVHLLGLRFLWIDSLCIFQDDAEDWLLEGSKMSDIYSQSSITLAASSSPNPNGGLFRSSTSYHRAEQVVLTNHVGIRSVYYLRVVPKAMHDLPLLRRAWFYQERKLSKRVVHFCTQGLEWETESEHKQEFKINESELYQETKSKRHHLDLLQNASAFEQQQIGDDKLQDDWRKTVLEYASMDLSFPTDKLPAIQGVAKRFGKQKMCRYYAGLWEDTLMRDLLWYSPGPQRPPTAYLAPSWSWASRQEPIAWLDLIPFSLDTSQWSGNKPMQVQYTTLATAVHVETTPLGHDATGPVKSGELHIRGPCERLKDVCVLRQWLDEAVERTCSDFAQTSSTRAALWPSQSIDLCSGMKQNAIEVVEILAMHYAPSVETRYGDRAPHSISLFPERYMIYCLLIQQISHPPDRNGNQRRLYRRVGVALLGVSENQRRWKDRQTVNKSTVVII